MFLAAARVGGIVANDSRPASFIYDNLAIATNVIEAARAFGVEKLVNLGSTCIYPKFAAQPMSEDELLSGPLEPTNQWYAVAKIAAIKLCDAYRRQYGLRFHLGDADKSLRPERQFRSRILARHPRADRQDGEGEGRGLGRGRCRGAPVHRAASSCMSTIARMRWSI